jgi:transcriptional regulator with GAF, ATPase, and Fis domain
MPHRLPDSRQDLERRVLELSGLLEIARAMVAAPDSTSALRHFLLSAVAVVGGTSGAVFRYDDPSGRLNLVVERGLLGSSWPNTVLSVEEVAFLEGSEAREGITVRPRPSSATARAFVRDQGSWLATYEGEAIVPLVGRGGLWGVALFGPRLLRETYGPAELAILATSAQIAASPLENLAFHLEENATAAPGGDGSDRASSDDCPDEKTKQTVLPANLSALRDQFPVLRDIVGESDLFAAALRELAQVAPTRCPVLVLGETGTGKELAARAIHRMSPRSDGPFEVVDCGAIPRELIESELFGHVRGAFTGATRDRRGTFELAHGGTLFLDEIGEMPTGAQTRLLRVLQEGHMRRVGDERTVHVDVRVVAATNRDLLTEVKDGRFRADVYYRIGVFTVKLPSLRDRKVDIGPLAEVLIERLAVETGRPPLQLSRSLMRRLSEYPFPGNVRELQNILTVLLLRSAPEGPTLEDLEAILAQASGTEPSVTTPSINTVLQEEVPETPAGKRDAESTGRWVLNQLRRCDFNLSQTERTLARLRRSPAGRTAAPVADRSSLTYYLQGECFKAFAECDFDLASAARTIAGIPDLEPRARARLEGFLEFLAGVVEPHTNPAEVRAACRERLPKLPAHYLPYLDSIAEAYLLGEWAVPAEKG